MYEHPNGYTPSHFRILWDHQRGRCAYCLCKLTATDKTAGGEIDYRMYSIDHVKPLLRSRGEVEPILKKLSNKVLACRSCNFRKGPRTWKPRIPPPTDEEARAYIEKARSRITWLVAVVPNTLSGGATA